MCHFSIGCKVFHVSLSHFSHGWKIGMWIWSHLIAEAFHHRYLNNKHLLQSWGSGNIAKIESLIASNWCTKLEMNINSKESSKPSILTLSVSSQVHNTLTTSTELQTLIVKHEEIIWISWQQTKHVAQHQSIAKWNHKPSHVLKIVNNVEGLWRLTNNIVKLREIGRWCMRKLMELKTKMYLICESSWEDGGFTSS